MVADWLIPKSEIYLLTFQLKCGMVLVMLHCSKCKQETTKLTYPVGECIGLCDACFGDRSDTPLQSKASHKGTYYPSGKGAPAVKFNWKNDHGGRGLHPQYLKHDPGEIRELAAREVEETS